jgi:hypothetical protein
MVLGFGGAGDVNALITKKNYAKAIEVIQGQLAQRKNDPRLRMQLADVMSLAGRGKEAVAILLPLADDYARDGFAAKAIAVLKKVEKIEPRRSDVNNRLAGLIKESKPSPRRLVETPTGSFAPAGSFEIGMEEIGMEAEVMSAPAPPALPDFDTDFVAPEDLDLPGSADAPPPEASHATASGGTAPAAEPSGPVENALFAAFTQEELVEVMGGLELLTFESGDIIITEGEQGDSLFVLTSGVAKAFIRDPKGKSVCVRAMRDGEFFGEISLLTGKARTATITAATRCELLELDRAALDSIAQRKPHVKEVLQDFYVLRANSLKERRIRRGG